MMAKRALEPIARNTALTAGLGLLAMTVLAILAVMIVFEQIRVPGDPEATASNIIASQSVFRAALWGTLLVLILDVVVAWALYVLLEPVNAKLSLFTAWLRVVYAAILGVALSALAAIAVLVTNADVLPDLTPPQLHTFLFVLFNVFYEVWGMGLIVFGAHLLTLGILTLRADFVPRLFGILLIIAGVSYIGEYTGRLLFPGFDVPLSIAGWGELLFMFWLLWAGRPAHWFRTAF